MGICRYCFIALFYIAAFVEKMATIYDINLKNSYINEGLSSMLIIKYSKLRTVTQI